MMKTGLVLAVVAMAMAQPVRAMDTPAQENLSYEQARQVLLARGFEPFVMPGAPMCEAFGPRCYPELLSCVQKRHWICDYTWRQGKAIFQLETHSDVPMVDSFYCLVNCTAATNPALDATPTGTVPLAPAAKSP